VGFLDLTAKALKSGIASACHPDFARPRLRRLLNHTPEATMIPNRALSIPLAALLAVSPFPVLAQTTYNLTMSTPLGMPDRWDYVVFSRDTGRVYVAHGDKVAVIDASSGDLVGQVEGIAGATHGSAISAATGQGFTDDGRNGLAIVYDLRTLKITRQIPADKDADAIALDNASGHVFVIEGDPGTITVIDPRTDAVAATIRVDEKMEYGAGDGRGAVFVAGEEKRDLVKIDARTNTVVAHWPTPDCASPHGLALDAEHDRAFMGCVNSMMMVVDTTSGALVARLPIGRGNDAVAYDPRRKRVFSSNGLDGTISVYQEVTSDKYEALDTITTAVSGRTMDVDPETGRLFIAASDVDPPATPGGRPRPKAGTLRLMMLDPVP
jgi:DNA-binding beta-propeller fold protein YncE